MLLSWLSSGKLLGGCWNDEKSNDVSALIGIEKSMSLRSKLNSPRSCVSSSENDMSAGFQDKLSSGNRTKSSIPFEGLNEGGEPCVFSLLRDGVEHTGLGFWRLEEVLVVDVDVLDISAEAIR